MVTGLSMMTCCQIPHLMPRLLVIRVPVQRTNKRQALLMVLTVS